MENWIKAHVDKQKKAQEDLDAKYPDRHTVIHREVCKHCPSAKTIKGEDMELEDTKNSASKEWLAKEALFVCAWRQSKLCKGLCDYMDIDQEFLNNLK